MKCDGCAIGITFSHKSLEKKSISIRLEFCWRILCQWGLYYLLVSFHVSIFNNSTSLLIIYRGDASGFLLYVIHILKFNGNFCRFLFLILLYSNTATSTLPIENILGQEERQQIESHKYLNTHSEEYGLNIIKVLSRRRENKKKLSNLWQHPFRMPWAEAHLICKGFFTHGPLVMYTLTMKPSIVHPNKLFILQLNYS